MSLLQNNTEALNRLRGLDKAALESIFGTWQPAPRVVGALYNADTDGMKNILLHANPAGVVAGLKIAATLTGTADAVLVVREDFDHQELMADAGIPDLKLTVTRAALVNKMAYKGARLLSLDELAALADRLLGGTPGVLVALDGELPAEEDPARPVADFAGACKGILAGHRFYNAEQLSGLTLGEAAGRSGVLHRLTDAHCPVHEAKAQLTALRGQSCGKCTFCREGLYQLSCLFEDVANGRAKPADLDLAREIGNAMTVSCNCTLGEEAALPVLTALDAFDSEVQAHVRRKECAAGACLALTRFYVDPKLCQGSGACVEACPAHCIEGGKGLVAVIDGFDCTRCGKCLEVCQNGAVKRTSGRLPKLPAAPVPVKGAAPAAETENQPAARTPARRKRVFAAVGTPAAAEPAAPAAKAEQPKPVEVKIMKTIETDVVIVAGGPAGLAAAVTVGEQGLKSVMLEKSSTTGGAANMGMGPLGIDTKIQRAQFNNISVEQALQMHMEYTHYRVDEDLVQTYFHKSADTIEWLQEMGVEFAGAFRYFKESEATWHIVKPENGVIGPRAAGAMVKVLTQRARELGCDILHRDPRHQADRGERQGLRRCGRGQGRQRHRGPGQGGAGGHRRLRQQPGNDREGVRPAHRQGLLPLPHSRHHRRRPEDDVGGGRREVRPEHRGHLSAARQPELVPAGRRAAPAQPDDQPAGRPLHERGRSGQHHLRRQRHRPAARQLRLLHHGRGHPAPVQAQRPGHCGHRPPGRGLPEL